MKIIEECCCPCFVDPLSTAVIPYDSPSLPFFTHFLFSPWGLWLGSYLTWPISFFCPRAPDWTHPWVCMHVGEFVRLRLCVCMCLFCGRMWSALVEVNQRNPRVQRSNSIAFIDQATFSASVPSLRSCKLSPSLSFLRLFLYAALFGIHFFVLHFSYAVSSFCLHFRCNFLTRPPL